MRLLLWVHLAGGSTLACQELGVGRWLLYQWLSGRKEPDILQKAEIYRVTHGAVTPEDIAGLRFRHKRFPGPKHCPCCGRAMSQQEFDDMRRRDHGLRPMGGGRKGTGRKKAQ
jgi:DNA-binding transcriptional regulator YdaS (Cro superfamily)